VFLSGQNRAREEKEAPVKTIRPIEINWYILITNFLFLFLFGIGVFLIAQGRELDRGQLYLLGVFGLFLFSTVIVPTVLKIVARYRQKKIGIAVESFEGAFLTAVVPFFIAICMTGLFV